MRAASWGSRSLHAGMWLLAVALASPVYGQQPAKSKSSHPVVAGFERFFAAAKADASEGGWLLLSELNCLSCHRPQDEKALNVSLRKAPILDGVASRVKPGFMKKFLSDPQAVKPGTTMPHLLAGMPPKDREEKVEQLVHFLATTGALRHERPEKKIFETGRQLYHRVGCVACHGTRDAKGDPDKLLPTSIPLGDLKSKYTIPGLAAFLDNPHQVRPSGRMPGLLKGKESREVAQYLLQGIPSDAPPANMKFAYYEGSWSKLPDFAKLKPLARGEASGFDLTVARRGNDFALTFEGFLLIPRDGDYQFFLTSDDGSRLLIDGKQAAENDGVHPPSTTSGRTKLKQGTYPLFAAVFNAGGGVELNVEIEGPGLGRQPISPLVFLTPQGNPQQKSPPDKSDDDIAVNPALVAKGRELFATIGCANCHQLGSEQKARLAALPFEKLKPLVGCLAEKPVTGVPQFSLSGRQRSALAKAISPGQREPQGNGIDRTLVTFNCYACHDRDKKGGREETWNAFFTTTQPEMGDEGRIPPTLTGVGAKMTDVYLKKIMAEGSQDRPYMHTRMPRFGEANAGHLVTAFAAADKAEPTPKPGFKISQAKVKAAGRHMVGGLALGCVKCHTFAGKKAEGVQGIDMTLLTQRLQRDWFYRYLLDPQKVRPGTRMPTAWPMGQSTLANVLDGDAPQQIEAIWMYLSDGAKASLPVGLGQHFIALVPDKEAIIYRNFVEGAGSRAIAVGYPEKAHLAFDANDFRLALIWHGAFIDAARHWTDRGAGYQPPLGDGIIQLPKGVSFAILESDKSAWPTKPARELGFQFLGYRLTPDQRPTFRYSMNGITIEDFPTAVEGKTGPAIRRQITLTASESVKNLWFRAAQASKIEPAADGWYVINNEWRTRLEAGAPPVIREIGGQKELLVPVHFDKNRARIMQELTW